MHVLAENGAFGGVIPLHAISPAYQVETPALLHLELSQLSCLSSSVSGALSLEY